jgi:DNA invertase Pin-like site-specific DNA recombinase
MRVVAYIRVSSARQRERYGPDVQRGEIRDWASRHGHRIIAWHTDVIGGASELDSRDGWLMAAEAVKSGKAEGVVVARIDRLARDVMVQEYLLRNLSQFGGVVLSARDSETEMLTGEANDPSRKLIRTILGAVSEYDREMTVTRLAAARRAKAARGGYAHGTVPYGYRSRGGVLLPVPAEQRTLTRMCQFAADGMTPTAIAAQLNTEAVPTRRGAAWSHVTVTRILKRNEQKAS